MKIKEKEVVKGREPEVGPATQRNSEMPPERAEPVSVHKDVKNEG
jgi:hypothetical protein